MRADQRRRERHRERELVEAARHDANAFAELYRNYVHKIYAYAFRRSGSSSIAEDVTSATFEKALRGLASYRWREPGIGPWLFRIASNELVNIYRAEGRQEKAAASLKNETSNDLDGLSVIDDRSEIVVAMSLLRPRYQRALSLRYLAGLSTEEAAAAMGLSRGAFAVVVHRSLAALRKVMESAPAIEKKVRHG